MIRKLFFCLLAGFALIPSFAQEVSVSKQINQIKRDSTYLYSEATVETAEDALTAARGFLMTQVQEYLESNQKTTTMNEAVRQSIYAKTESLEMMRGSSYRVLVYVKKSDVNAIFGIQQPPVQEENPPVVQSPKPEGNGKPEATSDTPVTDRKTVADAGLPVWQMNAIKDLLKCSDVNEVRAKFNRMKAEYKIKKYGVPDNCPSPDDAFWLIFSQDGSVNTVLGPGTKERVNFRDMTTSELDNYKGMNALWFNFAN